MSFVTFLICYALMVALGGPLIAGWYIITRGQWYAEPDGALKKYGMIFKEWSLFWEQHRQFGAEKEVFYKGDELAAKWALLKKIRPDLHKKYFFSPLHKNTLQSILGNLIEEKDLEAIKDLLACEVRWDTQTYFRLYQLIPVYRFPSWLRKPLSECIICMSSAYGSAMYWFIVLQVNELFSWSAKENLAKLGFWVIFCLILACYNKFLQQKMRLDV